jgi:hypothetical protein
MMMEYEFIKHAEAYLVSDKVWRTVTAFTIFSRGSVLITDTVDNTRIFQSHIRGKNNMAMKL